MTSEIAKPETRSYFEQYGDSVTPTIIVGKLLRMTKFGEWKAGQDGEAIPIGTRMLVNIRSLKVGWQKWVDNKPAEQRMGYVADGFQPPRRNELGDDDEAMWERMPDGNPRDPWQFTNVVIMMEVDSEELFTYSTGSKGGWSAIGELSKAYGARERQKPHEYPAIELQVRSYEHATYGEIRAPKFIIVAWQNPPQKLIEIEGASEQATLLPPDDVVEATKQPVQLKTVKAAPKPVPPAARGKPGKNAQGRRL